MSQTIASYDDVFLENRIIELENAIKIWATSKELWFDCGFQSFTERVDAQPRSPTPVTILWFEGPLYNMFNGTFDDGSYNEFSELLFSLGFECELSDHVSLYIYALDPILIEAFDNYFHWRWVCQLIRPDCADVYEELYSHFAHRPEDLNKLHWREFETLLFRIFQNQGFQTELGPGSGDGGVDVRFLQRDPLGDVLTLVQAKRYAPDRRIGLEAVAALHGVAAVEGAERSVFVTTSQYQPAAKKFAARTSGSLELRTSRDVANWCADASAGIVQDKSKLVSVDHVRGIIANLANSHDPKVVHASTGYTVIINGFALVIKETKYASLLMALHKEVISDDGYGQMGFEVPILDGRATQMLAAQTVWRAKRIVSDGRISYWDGRNSYSAWDGKPVHFDLAD